ncbi:sensor histidine kinase [Streptomyces fradiae]|uniref:sensor histidine kinase n=1 Tax=Streptomyces fradiae TaxID=1906 RepID=UPI0035138405
MRERLFDLGLWLLLCVPVLLRSDPADGGSWTQVAVGVAVLGGCVAVSRRWPLLPLAVTVAVSLPATLELFTPSYSLALVAFGYLAGRRQEQSRGAWWLFGAVAAVGLVLTRFTGTSLGPWFTLLLAIALAVVAPWLIGRYVRQYDRLVRSGWELADRMEREQAAVADRERLRERSRIAGDMHDSLGHDLALIAVRAGALEVDPALGPDQQHAAGELRRAAADATERLRDVIGVLREDHTAPPTTPPAETLPALLARAHASGLPITLTGAPVPNLPGMPGRALHRVVQEALTNAAKHAPGAPITVTVEVEEPGDTVRVRVANGPAGDFSRGPAGGPGSDTDTPRGPAGGTGAPRGANPPGRSAGTSHATATGTGLVGLDERVRLAGGSLDHGASPDGGFVLTATVPRRAPVAAPAAAPTSARELDRARREVRRDLVRAIWIPIALLVALTALVGAVAVWTQSRSYLEPDNYARLLVGRPYADLSDDLPDHPLPTAPPGLPPEPSSADECRYYRSTVFAAVPVYRLCFTDGRLVSKDRLG